MRVFHGSYTKIMEIDLTQCQPYRDFGRGFYVTKFRKQAETWAFRKGKKRQNKGVVTEFEFADTPLTAHFCKIKKFDGYNEDWLDFVVMNRNDNLSQPTHNYDIVEGPVADDKIQNRIYDYRNNLVAKEDFLMELAYKDENHQICFCTMASLQFLKRIENVKVSNFAHIGEPLLEKLVLDNNIDEMQATDLFYTSQTFARLADDTTEFYKKPWQEIYEMLKKEVNISTK
jgi:hypothetical protein